MNQVFLSDSCFAYFGTSSATTGAATNADSTPTVVVAEDGTDLGYVPTVTNVATGLYKVEIVATVGNGFEAGRRYNLYAVATVGGITGRDGIGEFEVLAVDLNTGVASVQGNVTGSVASVTGLTPANLDVAVSTRMATYAQPTGFLAAIFPALIASTTNITAGTITTTTNLTNLPVGAALEATLTDMKGATFTGATDSLEAIRDRGDAAWITATGFSTLTESDVRDAVGLASANLDTQLAALPAGVLTAAAADPIYANIKKVNSLPVDGAGTEADPWGPA